MSAAGNACGFTLIEVLVTLAIAGLIGGIAYPSLERALRRQEALDAAMRIEAALRTARADALGGGHVVRLRMLPDGQGVRHGDAEERLPAGAALRLPPAGIAFFADGSAKGGEVVLTAPGVVRRWRVQDGTGRVARLP